MMPGTPGQRCGAQIFQGKFAGEADRFEAIGDGKLIVEGIDGARLVVRDELRDEAARIQPRDLKLTLARDAMHGDGALHAIGGAPSMNFAAVEGAGVERKKDGVAAADLGDLRKVGILGPVENVAHRAVSEGDVPIHQARPFFGQSEKSGITDPPAGEGLALIGDFFHRSASKWLGGTRANFFAPRAVCAARHPESSRCRSSAQLDRERTADVVRRGAGGELLS